MDNSADYEKEPLIQLKKPAPPHPLISGVKGLGLLVVLSIFTIVIFLFLFFKRGENYANGDRGLSQTDDIFGGGWNLVRCVSSQQGSWHPATDNLRGTDSYGVIQNEHTTDTTFTKTWDTSNTSYFLFAYTDFSMYLVTKTETLFEYGAPTNSEILISSSSSIPYTAQWYIRDGNPEDPWCSVFDHSASDPGMVYGENSKTGHMEHLGVNGTGACVWVK